MTLDQSVCQGLTILNNAIFQAYDSGITPINVFGYSQSAVIASLEIREAHRRRHPEHGCELRASW